jgi:predicted ATPase
MVPVAVEGWGTTSFENDPAIDWFLLVEEAVEPGEVIASALDAALGEADFLGLDAACAAIAAAELSASCAGHAPERLPDHVHRWVDGHPHRPHDSEIVQAILAVERVREESELRELWDEDNDGRAGRWLGEIDDLAARLRHSGAGDPATLSP